MAMDRQAVLVVEDDPLVASFVCDVLAEFEFPVAGSASCGPEALCLALRESPNVAVIDIGLVGPMDGIELARTLIRQFGTAVIFLSGGCSQADLERIGDLGPVRFLHKPFRPSQLLTALEAAHQRLAEEGANTAAERDRAPEPACL
ncbi:MAG TPA: response regulator [Stellaceae bacterium]|nr:response regulator [Stellaceae bacterium]